jgi:hypothetical protein
MEIMRDLILNFLSITWRQLGGFHKWGYSKWLVYNRKTQTKMDDLGVPGIPMT